MESSLAAGARRPRVRDVRDHVTCSLCRGYLIDAVTVVRCLHTCQWPIVTLSSDGL